MSDEKPKRPGASRKPGASTAGGGDRPMRRKTAPFVKSGEAERDARAPFKARADKPRFDKPDGDKKPGFKKPDFKKASSRKPPLPPPTEKTSPFEGERIAKAMARAGVCSRRDAETWIADGRVSVNGRVLTSPAVNVREGDKIAIDGQPMREKERTRLFLFHKPAGLVTTAKDPEGRETVFAFLDARDPDLPRLVSVGRLDINTEGLLLLTNDGGLARALELPATGWTRRYRVRVHGEVDQARLDELKKGVTVDDVRYAPIDAVLDRTQGANAWLTMSLTEGKNREIKRVLEHLGLDVARLIRVSYGPFQLGDLAEGAVEEVRFKVLREQLGKGLAELAGVDFSSPLREPTPAEAQETRARTQNRSRKHVSVMRKERVESRDKGPRARIERGATADRKGRAVAVERITLTKPKITTQEGEARTRNARRFDALRRDGEGGRASRPTRKEGASRYERPARDRAEGGAERKERGGRSDFGAPRERKFERGEGRDYASKASRGEPRAPRDDSRAPRGDRAPRERNFDRGEGRASGARPPRGESGPRRERSDTRPPRGKIGKGGPRKFEGDREPGGFAKPRGADGPRKPFGGGAKGPGKGPGRGPGKGPRKGPPRKPRA